MKKEESKNDKTKCFQEWTSGSKNEPFVHSYVKENVTFFLVLPIRNTNSYIYWFRQVSKAKKKAIRVNEQRMYWYVYLRLISRILSKSVE